MTSVRVELGPRSYEIRIVDGGGGDASFGASPGLRWSKAGRGEDAGRPWW